MKRRSFGQAFGAFIRLPADQVGVVSQPGDAIAGVAMDTVRVEGDYTLKAFGSGLRAATIRRFSIVADHDMVAAAGRGGEIGEGTAGSHYSRDIPTRVVQ